MKNSREKPPVQHENRNYIPTLSVKVGILDLEKFLRQTDEQLEKYCKTIKQYEGEEFGNFTAVSKALGI